MKKGLIAVLVISVLLGGVCGFVWQRQRAADLRKAIATMRQTTALQAPEARTTETVSPAQDAARQQTREAIEKTRQEIATLETAWQRMTAAEKSSERPFTANQDPEKGPVRVAHFRKVGQATPASAFQTMIWALVNDDSGALTSLLQLSPAGREKLQAIAKQTERTPEKLLGMLLALQFLKEDGFEIGNASDPDPSGQVTLTVRRARAGRTNLSDKKLPLRRGPGGWQLPITDAMIDAIPSEIEGASMYVAPKPVRE